MATSDDKTVSMGRSRLLPSRPPAAQDGLAAYGPNQLTVTTTVARKHGTVRSPASASHRASSINHSKTREPKVRQSRLTLGKVQVAYAIVDGKVRTIDLATGKPISPPKKGTALAIQGTRTSVGKPQSTRAIPEPTVVASPDRRVRGDTKDVLAAMRKYGASDALLEAVRASATRAKAHS